MPVNSFWRALRTALVGHTSAAPNGGSPLQALIAALPSPAILLDADARIVAFNVAARALAPALVRGELARDMLRIPDLLDAIGRAGVTQAQQRVEFFDPVPFEHWYEVLVSPLTAGSAPMLLITFNDLTPIRRVEEMRADFVANASHELRTPLAALLGFIETLQGPAKDDVAVRERFLGIMQSQAARMARLIDDLLSLSRIELNAHLRPDTPLALESVIRQVADGLQTLARDRGVDITIAAVGDALNVLGDRDELVRALENLIENALKYGASGKRVDITLSRAKAREGGEEAIIAVRDYGPGIAREHLPRLTERFYRVDVADSRAQGGTGLGLALVKHILNRHGGRLSVESKPDQGATFTAHLPLAPTS